MIAFPILFDCLEQYERIPTPIPQFILGQVRRNRINPCRELLALVKSLKVSVNTNEHFLNQVFAAFSVTYGAVYKVQ